MSERKQFLRTIRSGYITILSVILVFGLSGLSFVYGWIWYGALSGTVAAVLFLIVLGFLLTPVADHIRYTLTKDAVEDCLKLAQELEQMDHVTYNEYSTVVRKYFGL